MFHRCTKLFILRSVHELHHRRFKSRFATAGTFTAALMTCLQSSSDLQSGQYENLSVTASLSCRSLLLIWSHDRGIRPCVAGVTCRLACCNRRSFRTLHPIGAVLIPSVASNPVIQNFCATHFVKNTRWFRQHQHDGVLKCRYTYR